MGSGHSSEPTAPAGAVHGARSPQYWPTAALKHQLITEWNTSSHGHAAALMEGTDHWPSTPQTLRCPLIIHQLFPGQTLVSHAETQISGASAAAAATVAASPSSSCVSSTANALKMTYILVTQRCQPKKTHLPPFSPAGWLLGGHFSELLLLCGTADADGENSPLRPLLHTNTA